MTTEMTRRAKIEAMLKEEPQDIFLRYSLAMELTKDNQHDESLRLFDALCQETPPHVPAFFRAAQILADQEAFPKARDYLRTGIEQARAQGDLHAAGEMSEMLSSLGQHGE